MKLFSVIYLKGHLAAAMFLWPGATIHDCNSMNAEYSRTLPNSPGVKSGKISLSDIKLSCEWHENNPVVNGVAIGYSTVVSKSVKE